MTTCSPAGRARLPYQYRGVLRHEGVTQPHRKRAVRRTLEGYARPHRAVEWCSPTSAGTIDGTNRYGTGRYTTRFASDVAGTGRSE